MELPKKSQKRLIKIGEKLRELRIDKGYTSFEAFAYENDLSRVQYWRLEKGSNTTLNSLFKVLDIHKISLGDFFKEID